MKIEDLRTCRVAIEFEKTNEEEFVRVSSRAYDDDEFLILRVADETRNFSFYEALELHAFIGAAIERRTLVREQEGR